VAGDPQDVYLEIASVLGMKPLPEMTGAHDLGLQVLRLPSFDPECGLAFTNRGDESVLGAAKETRREKALAVGDSLIDAVFEPVRLEYERIAGFAIRHQNAVMHHRISLYGPPCAACGKPLRTPKARQCASCGAAR